MKILIINDNIKAIGGAERVIANLIFYLRKNSHKVTLLGFEYGNGGNYIDKYSINLRESNNKLIRLFGRIFLSLSLYIKIRKIIKEIHPDIIDIHLDYKYPLTVLFATRGYSSIKTIHDFGFLCLGSNGISRDGKHACLTGVSINCLINKSVSLQKFLALYISQKIFKILERRQINAFISMNKIIYKVLIKKNYQNVFYLPNTTSIEYAKKPVGNGDVKKLSTTTRICYIGNLSEHKGINFLIRALDIVKKETSIKLKIISKDKNTPLKELINELHLGENVDFLTNISYKAILKELKRSTMLILPSVCMENSPLVILEAMALGIPVVASNIGGIPDLILDNKTGCLFKPRDIQDLAAKILIIVKNPYLVAKMGHYAQKIYNGKYRPKQHYSDLMKIYKFAFSLKEHGNN